MIGLSRDNVRHTPAPGILIPRTAGAFQTS